MIYKLSRTFSFGSSYNKKFWLPIDTCELLPYKAIHTLLPLI